MKLSKIITKLSFRSVSVRVQIIVGFGVLLILALLIASIGYVNLRALQTQAETTLQTAARIRELSLQVENEFLLARQSETAFITSWRNIGIDTAVAEHVTANASHLAQADAYLDELDTLVQTSGDASLQPLLAETATLRPLLDTYEEAFRSTVDLTVERSRSEGVEALLKDILDQLESSVELLDNPELYRMLLKIRAHEKSFFALAEQQYADNIRLEANRFVANVEASSPADLTVAGKQINASALVSQINTYVDAFKQLAALEDGITISTVVFREVTADINAVTSQIGAEGETILAQAQDRLAVISQQSSTALIATTVIALSFGIAAALILSRQITNPLRQLSQAAEQIGQGDLSQQVTVSRGRELFTLANAFNIMTSQLRNMIGTLERRVVERTRDLALAAEVGQSISQVKETEELLANAVEIIRSRFDLYYTQIYLADNAGHTLILKKGTGKVGQALVARAHRLPLASGSINGLAAFRKQAVIVPDTAVSSIFYPNPLLPDTRSEIAVPLLVGDHVIGVLDLQSSQPNSLTEGSLPAFEVVAGQLAIAIENANLFTEVNEARDKVEALVRRLTHAGWEDFLNAVEQREYVGYNYENGRVESLSQPIVTAARDDRLLDTPILISGEPVGTIRLEMASNQGWTPDDAMMVAGVAQLVAQQLENLRLLTEAERFRTEAEEATRRLTREGWDSYLETADFANTGFLYDQTQVVPLNTGLDRPPDTDASISQSLTVRGETIGYLEAFEASGPEEDKDELVTAVARQLSEHIENLRLISQTETALKETAEQARRNVLLSQTSEQLNRAETLDEIYKIIAENTAQILPSDRVTLAILNDDKDRFTVKSLAGTEKDIPMGIAQNISGSIVEKAIKAGTVIVIHDSEPNPYMGISSSMVAPLITNAGAIGTLNVGSKSTNVYDAADQGLMLQIASILSSVIENTRLFSQAEARAGELAVINEVAQVASEQLELKQLFAAIHKQIQNAFFTDAFFVALYDSTDELIHFPYMYDDGQLFDEEPISPDPDIEVAQVIKTGIPILANFSPEERRQAQATNENLMATNKAPSGMIFVPLRAGTQIIGALSVQNYQFHPYNESDLSLLEGIANHVAVAMENVRLFEATQVALADSKQNQREIEQRANELATINTVNKVASSQLNLAELLDAVGETLRSTFDAASVYFALYDPQTNLISFPYFFGEEGGQISVDPVQLEGSSSFSGQIIQTRQPLLHNTILEQSTPETIIDSGGMVAGKDPKRMTDSFLGVPMILGVEVLGVIGVSTFYERHVYNEDDQRLLMTLAGTISVAVQNARQYENARRRAERETLINAISQKIQIAPTVQNAMQTAVSELGQALKLKRVAVELTGGEKENGRNQPSQVELAGEPTHE